MSKRLLICIPLFVAGFLLLQIDFSIIWRYFAWVNQTLAVFTLWALTVYLVLSKKLYILTLVPALFMTAVCSTYIFIAPEGLGLPAHISQLLGLAITLITFVVFIVWKRKIR
jgi:carbon starvation protein CstA